MSAADRLARIRARAEAATPGPWNYGTATDEPMPLDERIVWVADTLSHADENRHLWTAWVQRVPGYVDIPALTGDGVKGEENAAFIAHAREDIPALLAAVERVLVLCNAAERSPTASPWIHVNDVRDAIEGGAS